MRFWLALPLLCVAVVGARAQSFQFDASLLHALHPSNTTGLSADFGAVFAKQNFVGLEWTYFNPKTTTTIPAVGQIRTSETTNLAQLAYRFSLPIDAFGKSGDAALIEPYVGFGIGLGLIRQTISYSSFIAGLNGASAGGTTDAEICYEGVGGLQINLTPNLGAKIGFRYIDSINHVKLLNSTASTAIKTLEAGITCRF